MQNFVRVVCIKDIAESSGIQLGEMVFFLGEDRTGHCAVVNADGKVIYGWHTDNFAEIDDGVMVDEQSDIEICDKLNWNKDIKRWILPKRYVKCLINRIT